MSGLQVKKYNLDRSCSTLVRGEVCDESVKVRIVNEDLRKFIQLQDDKIRPRTMQCVGEAAQQKNLI